MGKKRVVELFLTAAVIKRNPMEGAVEERPTYYGVGQPLNEHGNPVKSIEYLRDSAFGHPTPCYSVKFEGSDKRQIVPLKRVVEITVQSPEKAKSAEDEAAPEPPE
jgi:hypothetical protein